MKKMNRLLIKTASIFAAASAAAVVATAPRQAGAWEVVSAAACWNETDYATDYVLGEGLGNQSSGLGSRTRRVVCSIPNTDTSRRIDLGSVFISGHDGHNGNDVDARVRAHVCLKADYMGTYYDCSETEELTGGTFTGIFESTLGSAALAMLKSPSSTYYYAHLMVFLPRQGPVGRSEIYGFQAF